MGVLRVMSDQTPLFAEVAQLFDLYRQHYGANPAPEAVTEWLREQVFSDRARVYVVTADDGRAQGICDVAVVPASLTLRTVWLVRDLYVLPAARRQGVGRALIAQVAADARAGGAHRLSLQTEAANQRAVDLYAGSGFVPEPELLVMERVL